MSTGTGFSDLPLIQKGVPPVRPGTPTDARGLRLGKSELHERCLTAPVLSLMRIIVQKRFFLIESSVSFIRF
jgi:hypothetical protein